MMILYRGPLASCNYDCPYCPFAKRRDSPEQLRADRSALGRFVDWATENPDGHQLSVLFTPWGEGLTRRWYRDAMVTLSHLSHVDRVAIQTNLSCRLDWLAGADPSTVALWATYHPGEVSRAAFLAKCAELQRLGIRYSVGTVGLPEHLAETRALRSELPEHVYLWVNAADGHSYDAPAEAAWSAIDPLFGVQRAPARLRRPRMSRWRVGHLRAGRRHRAPLPLHPATARQPLRRLVPGRVAPRPCTNALCDCHIGYVHLKRLPLYDVFAGGVLERIPAWGVPPAATSPALADGGGCAATVLS